MYIRHFMNISVLESTIGYTNCVKVTGLPQSTTEKELIRYFEDRRVVGGGPVSNVDLDQSRGMAYITFRNHAGMVSLVHVYMLGNLVTVFSVRAVL